MTQDRTFWYGWDANTLMIIAVIYNIYIIWQTQQENSQSYVGTIVQRIKRSLKLQDKWNPLNNNDHCVL